MRLRLYRTFSRYLQTIGGIVTVLVVLSPKWGSRPDDFYLGYPKHFYVTQYDVAGSRVWILPLLYDLLVVGLPVFAIVFAILWVLSRLTKGGS